MNDKKSFGTAFGWYGGCESSFWLFLNSIIIIIVAILIPATENPSSINLVKSLLAIISMILLFIGIFINYRNRQKHRTIRKGDSDIGGRR